MPTAHSTIDDADHYDDGEHGQCDMGMFLGWTILYEGEASASCVDD